MIVVSLKNILIASFSSNFAYKPQVQFWPETWEAEANFLLQGAPNWLHDLPLPDSNETQDAILNSRKEIIMLFPLCTTNGNKSNCITGMEMNQYSWLPHHYLTNFVMLYFFRLILQKMLTLIVFWASWWNVFSLTHSMCCATG